ncbi:CsbD family protein [Roseiconus nitratireducens]|uniref:CsbD family protein n=1 Tax=Roseiconus nitratireducens TaxID=2605748 RepID=A0A5M6DBQ3_9BACT|nr:CsbD family protein [Roseiconus nitratireducens]KAA5542585.1 CsbD family protein [Roseiconus nitratireducens]
MISQDRIQGHWDEVKGQLRSRWGQLTDDDLQRAKGSAEHLVGVIQAKTGEARHEIEHFLHDVLGGRVSRAGQQYSAAMQQFADEASDYARRNYRRVASRSGDYATRLAESVRERPAESLAVAFGLGIAAGAIFLFRGRR